MKHALASHIAMSLATRNGSLLLPVRDDGMGGADPSRGSGLAGLADHVEALGGSIHVHSAAGAGTHIIVDLPGEHEPTQDARLRNYQPRPGPPCKGSAFCRSHTSGTSYSPDGFASLDWVPGRRLPVDESGARGAEDHPPLASV
jgi:hypothetical protein